MALTPPQEALEHLGEFWEPRREVDPALRWTDPEQWHLTLAFLADVPERALDDLGERLERAARRRAPFECRLRGGGVFPDATRARVLWVGVEELGDGARLPRLAEGVRASSNRAGATPEGGPFRPHLTLARFRVPQEATRWIRVAETYEGPPWRAEAIHLIESRLGQGRGGRPRYEVVDSFPLGGREGRQGDASPQPP